MIILAVELFPVSSKTVHVGGGDPEGVPGAAIEVGVERDFDEVGLTEAVPPNQLPSDHLVHHPPP